jgi:hypothetical protein
LKLDKLVKDSKLIERLDKLDPDNASGSKNDGINYWKGKKIVTLAEWKKKIGRKDKPFQEGIEDQRIKEALQYFPDDYEKSLFAFVVPQELKEAGDKWYNQYLELMQFRNNLKCSRLLCFGCLLCPDKEKGAKLVGISRLIAKAVEVDREEEDDNSNSTTTTTTTPSLYPCPVLNMFKCPYDRKEMKEKPKYQQHLVRNEEEGKEEDSNSYDIDLDYLFLLSDYAFRVESAFIKAKKEESVVPIKNVEDIYVALTDRETLDKLLQQELGEEQLEYKDEIVEFFMSIKDTIRMEDLAYHKPTDT